MCVCVTGSVYVLCYEKTDRTGRTVEIEKEVKVCVSVCAHVCVVCVCVFV